MENKITITLEMRPNGEVAVVSNPSFATIAQMIINNERNATKAHSYAIRMMNAALEFSKKAKDSGETIILPRLIT